MWRSLHLVLHYDTLTIGETINDSSAALHLRYLQVDLPKECKIFDKLQCPSFLILLRAHELNFPSFRLWTASARRRTRQWSSPSPSTWWTACWAARPTRRSSRWRKRTPPRRDMLDMDRDLLDGLKTKVLEVDTKGSEWNVTFKLFEDRISKSLIKLVRKCISTSWIY